MFNFEQSASAPCGRRARKAARPMRFGRAAVAMDQPASTPEDDETSRGFRESIDFELLYLLEKEPGLTQREIADRLGISLGKVNYCLKGLADKGAIKLSNFRASNNKLGYVYVLTPKGIGHRVSMTRQFLARKLAEYERLKEQIEALRTELPDEQGASERG
jgi:EPS-associated MarR family transcriptional regulator